MSKGSDFISKNIATKTSFLQVDVGPETNIGRAVLYLLDARPDGQDTICVGHTRRTVTI
jgi:hypothetical protein